MALQIGLHLTSHSCFWIAVTFRKDYVSGLSFQPVHTHNHYMAINEYLFLPSPVLLQNQQGVKLVRHFYQTTSYIFWKIRKDNGQKPLKLTDKMAKVQLLLYNLLMFQTLNEHLKLTEIQDCCNTVSTS